MLMLLKKEVEISLGTVMIMDWPLDRSLESLSLEQSSFFAVSYCAAAAAVPKRKERHWKMLVKEAHTKTLRGHLIFSLRT